MILTSAHPQWQAFIDLLAGPGGCNFSDDGSWKCYGGNHQGFARKILSSMPAVDVEGTLDWCRQRGGHCDCEIVFNCGGED